MLGASDRINIFLFLESCSSLVTAIFFSSSSSTFWSASARASASIAKDVNGLSDMMLLILDIDNVNDVDVDVDVASVGVIIRAAIPSETTEEIEEEEGIKSLCETVLILFKPFFKLIEVFGLPFDIIFELINRMIESSGDIFVWGPLVCAVWATSGVT